jgi:hypothetical protein
MFGISVNDVPGWSVAIPPSAIGVPVAFTPGLVPHCDVLDVFPELADGLLADGLLGGVLLPHPARAAIPIAATSVTFARTLGARRYIRTCLRLLVVKAKIPHSLGEVS